MRRKGSRPGRSDGGRPAVPAGDARALRSVVAALRGADSAEAVISVALDTIRSEFGWEYASFWREDPQARVLRFAQESGSVSDDFRQVTATATFAPGVGLAGRTWQSRRLIHVPDLGEVDDCVRAPVARRAGVRAGVCLPLVVGDRVIGTMDFLAVEQLDLTEDRRLTLEAVADLVGQSLTRLQDLRAAAEIAEDSEAVTASVSALNQADDEASALRLALDQVRSSFGWAYGSVWTVGDDELLRFAVESGTVNPEFREITLTSTFARGVGLSGRAWQQRRLIFVEDLAEVTDCVRAPAARRAGVQSGVCLPIVVDDQVVATMDFFATHRLEPGRHRLDALASVGTLVGQALQRLRRIREVSQVAAELAESVAHVAEGSGRATVAANTAVEAAQHALTAVTALEASSKDIGNIARVISGIAEQTNLLALNATIEAARAGEAGKGFAVVAQEVKELARETAQATDDVASRIASIQADTVAATASIDSIGATIAQIHEIQNDLSAVLQQQSSIASAFVGQPGRN